MPDFGRKKVHDKSSAPTSTHQIFGGTYKVMPAPSKDRCMYAVMAMNSNGEKTVSQCKRQDFTVGKCYIACPLYTLLAVLKVFLIHFFPFSSPSSLGADFITGIEEKMNNWSQEEHPGLFTWFPLLPSPTRSLLGGLQWLRELMCGGSWEPWLWDPSLRCVVGLLGTPDCMWSSSQVCTWFGLQKVDGCWVTLILPPLFLECIQCDLCLTATALSTYRSTTSQWRKTWT